MRLFAAVVPPEDALDELARAVDQLHAEPGARRLRWTGRPGWHYTLAFMGEVEDRLLPELHARLERAARHSEPFRLRMHGGGRFDGRVLWVGAAGDLDGIRLLAERTEAAARRAGVSMEQHRRYTAHLTLARSRYDADLRPYVAQLSAFEGEAWTVDELALVRSNLPGGGQPGEQPRYEIVEAWPLGR
ncbi:RNA 2',3'-cyclic phosphodiesterase [Streptomyces sannanensis]|uniref:RNA 2',3'-cyclic phosphodiesterase n=1 Tax=Streptomyces sannanensis TaxID=285536 RepID=A0ABP6SBJ5_9ACTN